MSMNSKSGFLVALSLLLIGSTVSADELLVTSTSTKSSNSNLVSLDFESTGAAVGLQFKVKVPSGVKVDTKNCLSDLPKSHAGVCKHNLKDGYVIGMVYSDINQTLPKGIVPIGRIAISGKSANNISVMEFLSVDGNAKNIQSSTKLIDDSYSNK